MGSLKKSVRNGSDNGLMLYRQQAIFLINDGLIYWLVYASIGLN